MLMCCKSKPKPINYATIQQQNVTPNSKILEFNTRIPKSNIVFNANDFDPTQKINLSQFVSTHKLTNFQPDLQDRQEDYCQEIHIVREPKLISNKQILTYDLDRQGGITQVPVINTFNYQCMLNHLLGNAYDPNQLNNSPAKLTYKTQQTIAQNMGRNNRLNENGYQ